MKSYSQAYQDLFVLAMLSKKRDGTFLDIGCFHPIEANNTYLLEKEFGWKGMSLDHIAQDYGCRATPFIQCDATNIYPQQAYAIRDQLGSPIDYLSLDVDEATNDALPIALAFSKYRVITIEHDVYARGKEQQEWQRDLIQRDYVLVARDIHMPGRPELTFEDWYCAPDAMNTCCPDHHDAKEYVKELWKSEFGEDLPE